MQLVGTLLLAAAAIGPSLAAATAQFEAPQKVMAGGKAIEVEQPGYASPCLADMDGDGVPDLLVGQFNRGKIGVYKGLRAKDGKLSFGERSWLQAGGADAEVPGVW
ncbi:MAG: hypothetical protein HPKKFMNG_00364 [Planctomycetes bacterium]|nr:hypothetical protein [Planctomycetota bacterium]MCQ3948427.1 hypothetical protein [Planctomycetota bacterium]GIK52335.1 MAG: hypothetical protein BroJett014_13080 [Planctomycetota bacterium]HRJ77316.1 hypothetical protein [Planctomycetota bacterium]